MREVWENCRTIESEEKEERCSSASSTTTLTTGEGKSPATRARTGCQCSIRAGDVRDGEWLVIVDLSTEWKKSLRRLVPEPQVKTAYSERPQTRQGARSDRPEPAG